MTRLDHTVICNQMALSRGGIECQNGIQPARITYASGVAAGRFSLPRRRPQSLVRKALTTLFSQYVSLNSCFVVPSSILACDCDMREELVH